MEPNESLIAGPIKGYKAFCRDFTCRGFQFEIGQTYELPDGLEPIPCQQGFHFCQVPIHCNDYYSKDYKPRYAEIEAWDVIHSDNMSVARKIHIMKEIPNDEWDRLDGRFEGNMRVYYLKNGKPHRGDGPAIEVANSHKLWYKNGLCHREDGPAIERSDGTKQWYRKGLRHRKDGPAWVSPDGIEEWWTNGRRNLPRD